MKKGQTSKLPPLYSTFRELPGFTKILKIYVNNLATATTKFKVAIAQKDWESARLLSHQLKGSAGSYGFDPISEAAAICCQKLSRPNSTEEVRKDLQKLILLLNSVEI